MFDKTFVLANTAARSTVAYGLPDSVIFGDKWRENFSAIWREWRCRLLCMMHSRGDVPRNVTHNGVSLYQRNALGPTIHPIIAGTIIPATYHTATNGAVFSLQWSA